MSDFWALRGPEGIADHGRYRLAIHGPNGFLREFTGSVQADVDLFVSARFDSATGRLRLELHNPSHEPCTATIRDNAYGQNTRRYELAAASKTEDLWNLTSSERWYDLSVTDSRDEHFSRRFAGHFENGRPSTSDPALKPTRVGFTDSAS